MSQCRDCGARIAWGLTEIGRVIALNVPPEAVLVDVTPDQYEINVRGRRAYTAHSCPAAEGEAS